MNYGSAAARSRSDDDRLEEVNLFDAPRAHSLGIAVGIHFEVSARLLNHRRRVPGQRAHGPLVVEAGENITGITPLPVLQIARGTISCASWKILRGTHIGACYCRVP